jgi:predicted small metal-binding protein
VWYILCVRSAEVNRGGDVKSFECRDAGVVCNAKVTGETDEEVLAKAVEHARKKHGVDLTKSTTLAGYAQSLIRDERDSSAGT